MMKTFLRCNELVQSMWKTLASGPPSQCLKKWIDQKLRKEAPDPSRLTGKYELPYAGKNGKSFTTTVNLDFMQIQSEPRKDPSGAHRFEERPMACSLILVEEDQKEEKGELRRPSFTKADKTAAHPG